MEVPKCYIEKLNEILEEKKKYHGGELLYAYKDLWDIKCIFGMYRAPVDENYSRLIHALIETEIEIVIRLCNYEESQKRKGL